MNRKLKWGDAIKEANNGRSAEEMINDLYAGDVRKVVIYPPLHASATQRKSIKAYIRHIKGNELSVVDGALCKRRHTIAVSLLKNKTANSKDISILKQNLIRVRDSLVLIRSNIDDRISEINDSLKIDGAST